MDPVTEMVPMSEATAAPVAEIRNVTSFPSKSAEAVIVPTGGTQESNHFLTEKMVSGSQRTNISEYVGNNTPSISETTTLVTDVGGTITASEQSSAVKILSAAPEKHNSSLPTILGVSYPTILPFVRNGSVQEKSTPNYERNSQKIQDLNVTQHPKVHVLNDTLHKEMEKDNKSWSEEKVSGVLLLSSEEHTTDCGGKSACHNFP